MISKTDVYVHESKDHDLVDPEIVVPIIIELLQPKSVIDVGCGIGTWLSVFKKLKIKNIKGVDGPWCLNKLQLLQKDEIIISDLQNNSFHESVNEKYDLCLSLEVAEHLSERRANYFVQSLTSFSNVVLFSAAIPRQGGFNHLNEQWPDYWVSKFKECDYRLHDVMRPIIWDNNEIKPWYKQNMLLFIKNGQEVHYPNIKELKRNNILNVVHPDYLKFKDDYKKLANGEAEKKYYWWIILRMLGLKDKWV